MYCLSTVTLKPERVEAYIAFTTPNFHILHAVKFLDKDFFNHYYTILVNCVLPG